MAPRRKNHANDAEHPTRMAGRADRSLNWKALRLIAGLIAVVVAFPLLQKWVPNPPAPKHRSSVPPLSEQRSQPPPEPARPLDFDETLDSAVRYDQRGDRERADALFRQLLRQAARNTGYTEHMVALLPRAADFYSKGDEIPADQIENLYLDALDAIKRFRGEDHYDYEAVYGGLEKHYFSLGRYAESAVQTRQLLQFYRLKYVDNADSYYAVIQPTTMRLGRNLLAAGRNAEAREAYGAALEMAAEHHRPVAHIEELIKKTYEEAEEIEE